MKSDRFARLRKLLLEAAELPEEERSPFLDEACKDDPELRLEAASLLAHETKSGDFLKTAGAFPELGDTVVDSKSSSGSDSLPDQIAGYDILSQLGEGGMGAVYEAEQREPIRRRVALKIIKLGMDTKQVIARFEAERQALAMMDHPGIAQVYEAGSTETGRPFFVMELVRGLPITRYCDQERLSLSERLELFIQVCDAVQHAHHKGIVHRDIKPSNVMVTEVNDRPVVKVIDFGIAKATDQRVAERTAFTMMGQLVGTPMYMSPEQADPVASDVDTRSDVYSLGVLLYELITGTTPFEEEHLRGAAFDEIRRVIREDDPPTASHRVSTLGEKLEDIASGRQVDSRRFPSMLRGDLDAILIMALEKDRDRRYSAAHDFARDVEAFLTDEPVQATYPSKAYRMKKFVRRNRGPVIAGSLVVAALLLGLVGTTLFAVRATKAERQTAIEARTAQRVSGFLEELFRSNDPGSVREEELTAREILDEGAGRIGAELAGEPLIQARLQTIIGRVYSHQGHFDEADTLLQRALETYDGRTDANVLEMIECLNALAEIHCERGANDRAEEFNSRARELYRAQGDGDPLFEAGLMITYGNIRNGKLDYAGAEEILRRALALFEAGGEGESIDAATCLINIANNRFLVGDLGKADTLYGRAIAIQEALIGADHFRVATPVHNRALIAIEQGRYEDGLALEERALAIRERVLGDHWHTALSLAAIGEIRYMSGDLHGARDLLERALVIDEEQFEPIKYETGDDAERLARVYIELGLLDLAEARLDQAENIWRELGIPLSGDRGWLLLARGKLAQAQEYFETTMAKNEDMEFDCRWGLAEVARARGDFRSVKEQLEKAVESGEEGLPAGHPHVAKVRALLESL